MRLLQSFLATFLLLVGLALPSAPAAAGEPSMRAATDVLSADQMAERPQLPSDFRTLEGVYLRVHHHPEDRGVALLLARHAGRSIPDFADRLELPVGGTIDLYLAHTQAQFDGLQPGAPPDWADGTAWPQRGLIFLRSPDIRPGTEEPLTTVLDHEIVHILIGRAFRGQRVPHWLQEGVAQVYARQYTSHTTDTLASGLLGRDLMTLDDLASGFPSDPMRARLAYAQSADLVAWLINEHGPDTIPSLVHSLSMGQGFGAAMRDATGESVDDVDRAWRSRLASSGLWLKPLVSDTMMFGVGAIILVIGGIGVRRRSKEKLARMEAEESARDAVERAMGVGRPDAIDALTWPHPVADRDGYSSRPSDPGPTIH